MKTLWNVKMTLIVISVLGTVLKVFHKKTEGMRDLRKDRNRTDQSIDLNEPSFAASTGLSLLLGAWRTPSEKCRRGQKYFSPAAHESIHARSPHKAAVCHTLTWWDVKQIPTCRHSDSSQQLRHGNYPRLHTV